MPRLPGQRESSLELRGKIMGMAAAGVNRRAIAEQVGLSVKQVGRWIARGNEVGDRPLRTIHPGRARKTTREQDRAILDMVAENPLTNAVLIKEAAGLNVSTETVRSRLREANLKCRTPAKKIIITPELAERRIQFCQENLNRNWQNVIFTDEKTFSSSQEVGQTLWRVDGTRFEPRHVVANRRSGRISAGFWGWMSNAGPGEVVQITPPNFNARQYVRVLEDVMLPSVRALYPPNEMDQPIIFVQDNCPIHRARIVDDWFNEHPEFEILRWPARSPDLNPIENLWGNIVTHWKRVINDDVQERTVEALAGHVHQVWESFRFSEICQNLVNSMPRRLADCIENNGYYTRY